MKEKVKGSADPITIRSLLSTLYVEKETKLDGVWWKDILDILRLFGTKRGSFETWLKNTEAIIEENKITVYGKSDFQRDWLEERYGNLILVIVEEALGKEYEIAFRVDSVSVSLSNLKNILQGHY